MKLHDNVKIGFFRTFSVFDSTMYFKVKLFIGLNRKTSSSEVSHVIHIMFKNTAVSFQPVISDKTFHVMTGLFGYLFFKGNEVVPMVRLLKRDVFVMRWGSVYLSYYTSPRD